MAPIRIQRKKKHLLIPYAIICFVIGSALSLFQHGWECWVWLFFGVVSVLMDYTSNRNLQILMDDKGIHFVRQHLLWEKIVDVILSEDFLSIKIKKPKYCSIIAWEPGDRLPAVTDYIRERKIRVRRITREEQKAAHDMTYGKPLLAFAIFLFFFIITVFCIFYFRDAPEAFWAPFGFGLIFLSIVCIVFVRKPANLFQKTLNRRPYVFLWTLMNISLLMFGTALTVRLVYEPAETASGIRGLVTVMWCVPFLLMSFIRLNLSNR